MNINSQFYLFFCTSIDDHYWRHSNFDIHLSESKANVILENAFYWLKGKKIELIGENVRVSSINHTHSSLVSKICYLALAIFCFIPGIAFKAYIWLRDPTYINRRNKHIMKFFKKQSDFRLQTKLNNIAIKPKQFPQPALQQTESQFSRLYEALFNQTLSFLNSQDITSLALTCKKNHAAAAKFLSKPGNQFREFPNFLIKALGKEKLAQLRTGALPTSFLPLFEETKKWMSSAEMNCRQSDAAKLLLSFTGITERGPNWTHSRGLPDPNLDEMMGDASIQKIYFPEGAGVIFRIKENIGTQLYSAQVVRTIVIAKEKGKWMCVSSWIPPGLWFFLNELYFHEDSPHVVNYLKRLFNGESCGIFETNNNFDRDRFSEIVPEGPTLSADGITPAIELWKPPT